MVQPGEKPPCPWCGETEKIVGPREKTSDYGCLTCEKYFYGPPDPETFGQNSSGLTPQVARHACRQSFLRPGEILPPVSKGGSSFLKDRKVD